jgi:hypothetical protein
MSKSTICGSHRARHPGFAHLITIGSRCTRWLPAQGFVLAGAAADVPDRAGLLVERECMEGSLHLADEQRRFAGAAVLRAQPLDGTLCVADEYLGDEPDCLDRRLRVEAGVVGCGDVPLGLVDVPVDGERDGDGGELLVGGCRPGSRTPAG